MPRATRSGAHVRQAPKPRLSAPIPPKTGRGRQQQRPPARRRLSKSRTACSWNRTPPCNGPFTKYRTSYARYAPITWTRLRDGLNTRSLRDTEMEELREQRDAALAASRQAETAMQALRNVNQRLMIENSRLIAADTSAPPQTVSAALAPPGP